MAESSENDERREVPEDTVRFWANVRFAWNVSALVRASVTLGLVLCASSLLLSNHYPGIASLLVEVGAALALTLPIVLASGLIEARTTGVGLGESPIARRFRLEREKHQQSVETYAEAFAKDGFRVADLSRAFDLLVGASLGVHIVYPVRSWIVTVLWQRDADRSEWHPVIGGRTLPTSPEEFVRAFVEQAERTFSVQTGKLASIDDLLRPLARAVQQAADLLADRLVKPEVAVIAIWRDRSREMTAVLLRDGRACLPEDEMSITRLNVEALAVAGRFSESGDGASVVRTACGLWTRGTA